MLYPVWLYFYLQSILICIIFLVNWVLYRCICIHVFSYFYLYLYFFFFFLVNCISCSKLGSLSQTWWQKCQAIVVFVYVVIFGFLSVFVFVFVLIFLFSYSVNCVSCSKLGSLSQTWWMVLAPGGSSAKPDCHWSNPLVIAPWKTYSYTNITIIVISSKGNYTFYKIQQHALKIQEIQARLQLIKSIGDCALENLFLYQTIIIIIDHHHIFQGEIHLLRNTETCFENTRLPLIKSIGDCALENLFLYHHHHPQMFDFSPLCIFKCFCKAPI